MLSVKVENHSTIIPVVELSNTPSTEESCSPKISEMGTHLRERVKAARLHAQLTQEKLGELVGVSKSAVSMWETSNPQKYTRPTYENMRLLSKVTGAPLEWLVDDNAVISQDWKRPAEIFSHPAPSSRPPSIASEAAQLIGDLPESEQVELLHYLRVRTRTTAPR